MHASMVLTRSREGHQGPWHAVLHAIAQGIACPCAVCMMIPRECGHASCSRPLDTRLPHTYLSTLFSTRLEHPESGMQDSLLWHVLLRACFSHTSTILRPTAPPKLVTEVSRGVCVSVSCGHASCSRPSDTRLPHTHLHHPSSLPGSSIQGLVCKM